MNEKGSVVLIGAGPGDPGLMTLRGMQALESAEVVLFDRLVGSEILSMIPENAIKIDVGKEAGHHSIPQGEINGLIMRYAKEGKLVVRLKGGDPYLFGRGAEEIEALITENIPFSVVPGVTSAIAVPAYAGIPVSHRDFASSVHIITAHRKNGEPPDIDFDSLVKIGGTLIFLMGLSSLEDVASGLIAAGMSGKTAAALIENGTRPNQRKIVSTLPEIFELSKAMDFRPPSILVVGEVCALSDSFDWFSRLPLMGMKILVTRPKSESGLSQKLRALGADVTDFPCIKTEPLPIPDKLFADLPSYEWIVFTSPAGAEIFFSALNARGLDVRMLHGAKFAAIGPKTAAAVTDKGMRVDYIPEVFSAKELAAGLPQPGRTLLFRAEDGAKELAAILRERGFSVDDIAAYGTIRENSCPAHVRESLLRGDFACVTFTSASTVQGFTGSLKGLDCSGITALCIGAETASEALKHGFRIVVSKSATIESMIEKIREELKK